MGGLRAYAKTYICMWVGTLALVGIFPLSGGFSKDAIIGSGIAAEGRPGWLAFGAGVCGAFLTGVYAFRLLFLVFHGRPSEYAAVEAPKHTDHGEGPGDFALAGLRPRRADRGGRRAAGPRRHALLLRLARGHARDPARRDARADVAAGVVGDRRRDDGRRARLDPGLRPLRAAERRARAGADGQRPHPSSSSRTSSTGTSSTTTRSTCPSRPARASAAASGGPCSRCRSTSGRPRASSPAASRSSRPAPSAPTRSGSRSGSPGSSCTSWRRRQIDASVLIFVPIVGAVVIGILPLSPRGRVPVGAGGPRRGRRGRRPRLPLRAGRRPPVRGRRRVDARPRHPLPRRRRWPDARDDGHDRARHRVHARLRHVGRPRADAPLLRAAPGLRGRAAPAVLRARPRLFTSVSRPCSCRSTSCSGCGAAGTAAGRR